MNCCASGLPFCWVQAVSIEMPAINPSIFFILYMFMKTKGRSIFLGVNRGF
jgi:hypothetical protein